MRSGMNQLTMSVALGARFHEGVDVAGVVDVVVADEHPADVVGLDEAEHVGRGTAPGSRPCRCRRRPVRRRGSRACSARRPPGRCPSPWWSWIEERVGCDERRLEAGLGGRVHGRWTSVGSEGRARWPVTGLAHPRCRGDVLSVVVLVYHDSTSVPRQGPSGWRDRRAGGSSRSSAPGRRSSMPRSGCSDRRQRPDGGAGGRGRRRADHRVPLLPDAGVAPRRARRVEQRGRCRGARLCARDRGRCPGEGARGDPAAEPPRPRQRRFATARRTGCTRTSGWPPTARVTRTRLYARGDGGAGSPRSSRR